MASLQHINVGKGCRFCPEWVRVSEKLPAESSAYLVCVLIGDITCIGMSYFNGETFDINEVTHWMPLPLPPKQEEGD